MATPALTAPGGTRLNLLPGVLAAVSLIAVVLAAAFARHWPLVHDAPLIHYVVFLMDHGSAPYRDVIEMNMPGSYMVEWAVMHTLGMGSGGWLLWDLLTGAVAIATATWIAGPGRRWAGLAAGSIAYLLHLSAGPMDVGQRDWVVAVLLLLAWGCTFAAIRTQKSVWMTGAMFWLFCGATIKPPVVILAVILLAAYLLQGRPSRVWIPALLWSVLGAALPLIASLLFLLRWHVVGDFLADLRGLVPWYAALGTMSFGHLLLKMQPSFMWPLSLLALILFATNRSWRSWESRLLLLGALGGSLLYVIQRKGFPYHRYTALTFVLLWAMIEAEKGLRSRRLQVALSVGIMAFALLVVTPTLLLRAKRVTYSTAVVDHLEQDLQRLGGSGLNHHVQCLDMTMAGCINVLYRMQLEQSTGFIYDFYLFPEHQNATGLGLQERFLHAIQADPPRVIVLSSQNWPGDTYGYGQIQRWPEFAQTLDRNYQLSAEYQEPPQSGPAGYRIYELRQRASP